MIDVAVALVEQGGACFLQRRPSRAEHLPGLWELPGGKLEPGERPEVAVLREVLEELGTPAECLGALPVLVHHYPERTVRLHPFRVALLGDFRCPGAWGWFHPEEALVLPLPEATRRVLEGSGA